MYDVAIIGGGPGGYAAALYAHNFDLSVALVERDLVGGTCLHRGCIPAKSWLQTAEVFTGVARAGEFGVSASAPSLDWAAARSRKDQIVDRLHSGLTGLLEKRKVDVFEGSGRLASPRAVDVWNGDGDARHIEAEHVILATGSVPRSIPGYEVDGVRIVTSDHALDWPSRPNRVAIIGAGAIGVEFASMLVDVGAEVHLFEMLDQIVPGLEPQGARILHRALQRRGVQIHTSTGVEPARTTGSGVVVPFGGESVEVDVVLVAVGRAPVTDGTGIEGTRAVLERGFVRVDPATMETSEPGVYAVGDIVAGAPQLAHAGFAEGIAAVTHLATGRTAAPEYRAIPLIVYSEPEAATVGMTEAQATEAGYAVETHSHGFGGVARAMIRGRAEGTVKVVAERDGPILGATVVGPEAGEMIHELMYSVGWEALPAEAAALIHGHPTLSEAIGETLLAASGRPLH